MQDPNEVLFWVTAHGRKLHLRRNCQTLNNVTNVATVFAIGIREFPEFAKRGLCEYCERTDPDFAERFQNLLRNA